MPNITDAEVGQEIAKDGVLGSLTMTTPPTGYDNDYFCLADGEQALVNMHISTSAVSAGSSLLSGGMIPFKSLIVKSVPKGSVFEYALVPPPTLDSLSPDTAVSGDPDFVLSCIGSGFTPKTIIKFGDHDEPTTFVSATEVTTGVKPSLFAPAVVPVRTHNGGLYTDPLDFTFLDPLAADQESARARPPAKTPPPARKLPEEKPSKTKL
jgi:hypothetical protein